MREREREELAKRRYKKKESKGWWTALAMCGFINVLYPMAVKICKVVTSNVVQLHK